jgi:hypothetical protein
VWTRAPAVFVRGGVANIRTLGSWTRETLGHAAFQIRGSVGVIGPSARHAGGRSPACAWTLDRLTAAAGTHCPGRQRGNVEARRWIGDRLLGEREREERREGRRSHGDRAVRSRATFPWCVNSSAAVRSLAVDLLIHHHHDIIWPLYMNADLRGQMTFAQEVSSAFCEPSATALR